MAYGKGKRPGGLALLLGEVAEKKPMPPGKSSKSKMSMGDMEDMDEDDGADADAEMARPVLAAVKANDPQALAKALREFYDMG